MANNGFQSSSYANDRPPSSQGSGDTAEYVADPASSGFFNTDYKKHDDLKVMLDTNKDREKLEAMKRIIGMVAKGKDASDLFPAVVKNVVSKNLEVKKLVYVYLARYAEEQQDLALLSISTFQRALKDPNQLIRGSALRVLSSIRVPVIIPIMMLAIKESVSDMSPYVRKTASHAIPKLYSLDPEQKELLIEVIEKLLADKTTLVAGSAIQAFEEVCPERIDLVHKNYRKLCNLLVDVEEWGQVVIINMLTRYARMQFVNPNTEDGEEEEAKKAFYSDSNEDNDSDHDHSTGETTTRKKPYIMDPDHRLLLRTCKPLLNSRNTAVVLAVAQLYHHCAPMSEVGVVARALVRLLRSHKEVQYIVLSNIATMTTTRKGMFEPYLKSFFVRSHDPTHVKLLKLEILTNLATETNVSTILREFQTYVTSSDKEFAACTIQAIGRCASNISEVTDACLNGLVNLMSNRDENVVAESVVVIKKLLQMQPSEHKDIIVHMARLADSITVPMARASILWLIGEYSDRVPKIAPDVLRKMAKNFTNEEDIVKLQILNLAAKLCLTNSKQTKLLCQYVFNLAKYDLNYDIRDRARFLRALILPGDKAGALAKHAKKIFLSTKPAPLVESKFKDRDHYQLGTLSHMLNQKATGYNHLPEWPEEAPDPTVRNVEIPVAWTDSKRPVDKKKKVTKPSAFYSDEEEESEEGSDEESSEEESSSGEEEESSEAGSDEEEEEESEGKEDQSDAEEESEEEEESSSEEESSEEEESEEESEDEAPKPSKPKDEAPKPSKPKSGSSKASKKPVQKQDSMNLLDLDDFSHERSAYQQGSSGRGSSLSEFKKNLIISISNTIVPPQPSSPPLLGSAAATPVGGNVDLLMPTMAADMSSLSLGSPSTGSNLVASPAFVPTQTHELLNRITCGGLSATYRFTRTISVFSPKKTSVELTFTNTSDNPIKNLKIGNKKLQSGMSISDFPEVQNLEVNATTSVTMGIDFKDTTQPATFDLCTSTSKFNVKITAPVGELLQPFTMSQNDFVSEQGKLGGMHENTSKFDLSNGEVDAQAICNKVYKVANVLQVPSSDDQSYCFAAKTLSEGSYCLVSVKLVDSKVTLCVNCDKIVIGSMLMKDLKQSLLKA